MPVIGQVVTGAGQIPVHRESKDATNAMRDAIAAVQAGECVVVYPEGTLTRDPALWPMTGKTGAARIALASGCPVVPMAHWGAHDVLAPYSKRPNLLSRAVQHVRVGPPVDLADLMGRDQTAEVLRTATDRIMAAITHELEILRNETAPAERFDARAAGITDTGNPHIDYDPSLFTNRRSR
jgi:1-acyl-sn-glycerol-3-phosphate acyltransferase